jgi:nitrite reductase/ring-hydroxylating ferredoxin subunit
MALTTVARTTELKPGEGKVAEAGGKSLAVFNVSGTYHVMDNTCCHRGGPLGEGDLEGATVTCPWHGWRYDVTSGKCLAPNPAASVASYRVSLAGDEVQVDL